MKVLVFLDAQHQRKYVDIVRQSLAPVQDAVIEGIEAGFEEQSHDGGGAARQKRRWLPRRRELLRWIPFGREIRSLVKHRLRPAAAVLYRDWFRHPLRDFYRGSLKPLARRLSVATSDMPVLHRVVRRSLGFCRRLFLRMRRFSLTGSLSRIAGSVIGYYRRHSYIYAAASDLHWRNYIDARVFATQPDLIVLLEDNAQGLSGIVAQKARERSIPFVVLPDYIPNPAEPARFYLNDPIHSAETLAGRVVQSLAPRWVLRFDGRRLMRLPAPQILVRWLRKQDCPQPWILNAGYCETIFLESGASLDHYRNLGFKDEKLMVIGGAVEDQLHDVYADREARRRALYRRYAFDHSKPLIVCGFPPDQYTASTEGFEYDSFEDLCSGWFDALERASPDANILVVRHPRLSADILEPYLKRKIRLFDGNLDTVLPLADLYVACISTTIRWALALGIPVINYDCYRFSYGDFTRAKGIREIDSAEGFRRELGAALAPGGLDALTAKARSDAAYWGLVDGGFRARLRDAILTIAASFKGKATCTHPRSYRLRKWP